MMNKVVKILGTGCPKCKTTTTLVQQVIEENNIAAELIKVEDIMEIMKYNVMSTPAVVIDEQIAIKGRVPTKTEILDLLQASSVKNDDDSCCSSDKCC